MHATFLDHSILKDKILEVPRGSKQTGLRQATDEGLSYPVYIVQKHVSSKLLQLRLWLYCRLQTNIARLKKPPKSSTKQQPIMFL